MVDKLTVYRHAAFVILVFDPAPFAERLYWLLWFVGIVEVGYWALWWYRKQIPLKALPPVALPPPPCPPVPSPPSYWIAKSGKGHQANCRFFEKVVGRWGTAREGTACGLCGG